MKNVGKVSVLLVLALALILVLAASVWAQPMGKGMGEGMMNLTPEQAAKIFDLKEKMHADTVDLRRQMMVKHAEMAALWKAATPDQTAIQAKQKELNALRDQMQEKMTALQLEAKKIAPDFDKGMGMGMGPGGMGMGPGAAPRRRARARVHALAVRRHRDLASIDAECKNTRWLRVPPHRERTCGNGDHPVSAGRRIRLGDGPNPRVVVNRFSQRMFDSGLRRGDLAHTLGDAFLSAIPNDYALVREAIDRGVPLDEVKPGNKITLELKKLVLDPAASKAEADGQAMPLMKKLKLSMVGG